MAAIGEPIPECVLAKFEVLEKLGSGAYGQVFKVQRRDSGETLVVKRVPTSNMSEAETEKALNEAELMRSVSSASSKHVIQYYESFRVDGYLYIVMEYAPNGDLAGLIARHRAAQTPLEESELWRILAQVCQGLQLLHASRVLHRDIKAPNIFLDQDNNVKIGDFGLGRLLGPESLYADTAVGTPLYFSPEVVREKQYNTKSDMWGCGCLMYELACLTPPFVATNQLALARKIEQDTPEDIPKHYSDWLGYIIKKMLSKTPEDRPDAKQVLNFLPARLQLACEARIDALQAQHDAAMQRCWAEIEALRYARAQDEQRIANAEQAACELSQDKEALETKYRRLKASHREELDELYSQVAALQQQVSELQQHNHVQGQIIQQLQARLIQHVESAEESPEPRDEAVTRLLDALQNWHAVMRECACRIETTVLPHVNSGEWPISPAERALLTQLPNHAMAADRAAEIVRQQLQAQIAAASHALSQSDLSISTTSAPRTPPRRAFRVVTPPKAATSPRELPKFNAECPTDAQAPLPWVEPPVAAPHSGADVTPAAHERPTPAGSVAKSAAKSTGGGKASSRARVAPATTPATPPPTAAKLPRSSGRGSRPPKAKAVSSMTTPKRALAFVSHQHYRAPTQASHARVAAAKSASPPRPPAVPAGPLDPPDLLELAALITKTKGATAGM